VGNSLGWMIVWAGLLAAPPAPELARYEFSQVHMGMPFTLVLYAPDEMSANRAATAAYERIAQLDQVMSDYKADSELSKLTATAGEGKAVPVSDDLWRVLAASQKLSEQSSGAFDVTVGPYTKLWRRARRDQEYPTEKRLNEAREAVGFQYLKLDTDAQTALLERPGMRIDLGGIAVGYTLDEALKVLKANGISRALLDGSGDVLVGDPPPGKTGWRLGIAAPEEHAPPLRFIELANCAATTAGDTYQFVELAGRRFSHVIDPRTGLGLTTRLGVTVIAPDAMTADSLDTALSVLGAGDGTRLLEQYEGCEALFLRILDGGEVEPRETEGFGGFGAKGE
jgi:thiamine biosynthesis lipoprotein